MLTTIILWIGLIVTFFIGKRRWDKFPGERIAFLIFSGLTALVSIIYGLNLNLYFVADMLNQWFTPMARMVLK